MITSDEQMLWQIKRINLDYLCHSLTVYFLLSTSLTLSLPPRLSLHAQSHRVKLIKAIKRVNISNIILES